MWLLVENCGISDLETLTTLGISTSRECDNVIGQFGSGAKYSICTLLRHNLYPTIYLGLDKIIFEVEPKEIKGVGGTSQYNQIHLYRNGQKITCGFSLEFGQKDWADIKMALREIISNCIDASIILGTEYTIDIVKEVSPVEDKTRWFIPLTPEVFTYYHEFDKYFLHNKLDEPTESCVIRKEYSPCLVYRRGVLAGELKENSLFDYNVKNLVLDESRNADPYYAAYGATDCLLDSSEGIISEFLLTLQRPDRADCWEYNNLKEWRIQPCHKQKWVDCWNNVYQNGILVLTSHTYESVQRKGYMPIMCKTNLYDFLAKLGIPTELSVLDFDDTRGYTFLGSTLATENVLDEWWAFLSANGLVRNKERPVTKCYQEVVTAGKMTFGYFSPNSQIIYINRDISQSDSFFLKQTMLEELAHYITGSTDNSRDFQEYVMKVATTLLEQK